MSTTDADAASRFEWERIVRRCHLPPSTKLVAFTLAQYGNRDGTKLHPGNERLSKTTGLNEKTVRRGLEQLRDVGLIERVFHGKSAGRRGLADAYRLTIPDDLLERVEMLAPDEVSPGTVPAVVSGTPDTTPGDTDRNTGHLDPGTPDIEAGTPDMESVITGHHALTPDHDHPSYTKEEDHSASWTRGRRFECEHGYPDPLKSCAICRDATAPWDRPVAV